MPVLRSLSAEVSVDLSHDTVSNFVFLCVLEMLKIAKGSGQVVFAFIWMLLVLPMVAPPQPTKHERIKRCRDIKEVV